jgi:hypothetical protein
VPEADWIEQHQPVSDEVDDNLSSSEVRAHEAGISIEADVPEADWIEQHQPVTDEVDDNLSSSEVRAHEAGISIEADAPEADWIEQHQPVSDAPDEERLPPRTSPVVDAGELEHDRSTRAQVVGVADNQEVPGPAVGPRGGCNVLAAVIQAALRHGRDAARLLGRRNRRPPD